MACPHQKKRYPKHVWSPSGGWYAQPANWKANTAIAGVVMAGVLAVTWKFSSERESWVRKPEPEQWFPSRRYVLAGSAREPTPPPPPSRGKMRMLTACVQLVEATDGVGQRGLAEVGIIQGHQRLSHTCAEDDHLD